MSELRRVNSGDALAGWVVVGEDGSELPHSPRSLDTSPTQHELAAPETLPLKDRQLEPLSRNPFTPTFTFAQFCPNFQALALVSKARQVEQIQATSSSIYRAISCPLNCIRQAFDLVYRGWNRIWPFGKTERPLQPLGDYSLLEAWESCANQICYEIDQWQTLLMNYRIRKLQANWPTYPIKIGIGIQFGNSEKSLGRIVAGLFVRNSTEFDNFLATFLSRIQNHVKIECQDKGLTDQYRAHVGFLVVGPGETEDSVHALRKANDYSPDSAPEEIEHLMYKRSDLPKKDIKGELDAVAPYLSGDQGFYTNWVIQTDSWEPHSDPRLAIYVSSLGIERPLIQKRNHSD